MQTEAIAEEWLQRMLRTYPPETARFLAGEPDGFRNPLGRTLQRSIEILLDELLHGGNRERQTAALDSLMQVRAVENFEFLFQLKDILRVRLPGPHLEALYTEIDQLALAAFDLYLKYRERICEARTNEARRRIFVLERRLQPREPALWQERGEK